MFIPTSLVLRRCPAAWLWLLLLPLVLVPAPALRAKEKVEIKIVLQDGADLKEPLKGLLEGRASKRSEVWFFDTPALRWFGQSDRQVILRARAGEDPAKTDITVKLRASTGQAPPEFKKWQEEAGAEAKVETDQIYFAKDGKREKASLSLTMLFPADKMKAMIEAAQKSASAQGIGDLFAKPQQDLLGKAVNSPFAWSELRALGPAAVTKWDLVTVDFPTLAGFDTVTVERWIFGEGVRLTELSIKVPKEQAEAAGAAFFKAVTEGKGLPIAQGDEAEAKTKRFLDYFIKKASTSP